MNDTTPPMLTSLAFLSHARRVSLATLLTMFAVTVLEIAHFARGTSPVLEAGFFVIPAAFALGLFTGFKERVLAFLLLTAVGFLAVFTTLFFTLTP